MKERNSDRWLAVGLSVLLHGGVVALLVYGWWSFRQQSKPLHVLALDATVVDARALSGAQPKSAPPAPAPVPPPPPPPDSEAQRAAEQAEADKQAAEQRAAEEKRIAEQKLAEERAETERKAEAERQAQEEAERKAREAEEAKQKERARLAEAKRLAEEKRKQEEEARQQAEEEADLRKSLAEEEHLMAARSSGAAASWQAQITARITHAWFRPPSARPGVDCVLTVTQIPGGEIVNVKVGACNGDQAVRDSIEAAAYRASPLPPPPDPSLFERTLIIHFNPSD